MNILSMKETTLIEVTLNNPNVADILKLKREIGSLDYELIVAIGGGSVMDAAKVLSALQNKSYHTVAEVRDAITSERYREEPSLRHGLGYRRHREQVLRSPAGQRCGTKNTTVNIQ